VIQTIAGNGETRDGYNLACGFVKSTRIGGPLTQASVTFGPVPGAQNGKVTVSVQATGLAPSSQHGVPINLGSCTWPTSILSALPHMPAHSNGRQCVDPHQHRGAAANSRQQYVAYGH
jgi:hypothetical protein